MPTLEPSALMKMVSPTTPTAPSTPTNSTDFSPGNMFGRFLYGLANGITGGGLEKGREQGLKDALSQQTADYNKTMATTAQQKLQQALSDAQQKKANQDYYAQVAAAVPLKDGKPDLDARRNAVANAAWIRADFDTLQAIGKSEEDDGDGGKLVTGIGKDGGLYYYAKNDDGKYEAQKDSDGNPIRAKENLLPVWLQGGVAGVYGSNTGQVRQLSGSGTESTGSSTTAQGAQGQQSTPGVVSFGKGQPTPELPQNSEAHLSMLLGEAPLPDPSKPGKGQTGSYQLAARANVQKLGELFGIRPDQNAFNTYKQADDQILKGADRKTIESASALISHMGTANALFEKLSNGSFQRINDVKNWIDTKMGGAAPAAYKAASEILGDEFAKYMAGGQSALADRAQFQELLAAKQSQLQHAATSNGMKELMAGQLMPRRNLYEKYTGKTDFNTLLSPEAQEMMNDLDSQGGKITPPTPISANEAIRSIYHTCGNDKDCIQQRIKEYSSYTDGVRFIGPFASVFTNHGGASQ